MRLTPPHKPLYVWRALQCIKTETTFTLNRSAMNERQDMTDDYTVQSDC